MRHRHFFLLAGVPHFRLGASGVHRSSLQRALELLIDRHNKMGQP